VGIFFRKAEDMIILRDGRCGNMTSTTGIEAWHALDRKIDTIQKCPQPEEVDGQSQVVRFIPIGPRSGYSVRALS
jgi:hypothetical protein